MFKQLKYALVGLLPLFACSLYSLPLSSLRGFEFAENVMLAPLFAGYCGKNVVENIYKYGQSTNNSFTKLDHQMFNQVGPEDPVVPTKLGLWGKLSFYNLGYMAALAVQDIKIIEKQIKSVDNKNDKIETPLHKLAKASNQSPFLIAEQLGYIVTVIKGASVTKNKNRNEKITVTLYDAQIPLLLISTLAVERAETKGDYLEFLKGFYDHCSDKQKQWFTIDPNKIATNEWQELRYTKEYSEKLCAGELSNPSKADLFYACVQQDEPITWMSIKFTLPSKNNEKPKEISVGDCCESGVWATLQLILSSGVDSTYELSLLPKELQLKALIKDFVECFTDHSINDKKLRTKLFFWLSDSEFKKGRGKIVYNKPDLFYELKPSIKNILNALNYMFELDAKDFDELGRQLSSEKQTVGFAITEESLKLDYGNIVVTVKDLKTGDIRETIIKVSSWHVIVEPEVRESKKLDSKELLKKYSVDKTIFPFSSCFYTKAPGFNLYRLLSGKELNNVYRVWGAHDGKNLLLQKQISQLIDFKKVTYTSGDLNDDVLKILAQNADKSPFREFVEKANVIELVRMVGDACVTDKFINHIGDTWLEKNLSLELVNTFLKDKKLIKNYVENIGKKPYSYLSSYIKGMRLERLLSTILVAGPDTALKFLKDNHPEWLANKKRVDAFFGNFGEVYKDVFVKVFSKNSTHEFFTPLYRLYSVEELFDNVYLYCGANKGLLFLDKQFPAWKNNVAFLKSVFKVGCFPGAYYSDFCLSLVHFFSHKEHKLYEPFLKHCFPQFVYRIMNTYGFSDYENEFKQFMVAQKPQWKMDEVFLKSLVFDMECFSSKKNFQQWWLDDFWVRVANELDPQFKKIFEGYCDLYRKQKKYCQIMNITSLIAEACSCIPGLSSYAFAWRFGSLFCQGAKPVGGDSTVQKTAFLGLSAWQAWYVSNSFLKSLQK
ncbi:TPA: hypothetical protein DDZ86_04105 [Candidatus Dependentiae bacterium]|nr:MAG: hypothetical protein UW09_C0003G0169 [candidate division TM6 bacterium GW2011_GWF2_43_87]HBL98797.1 hypothetical protein [Candidatus Dependentiae bacterium]